MLNFGVEIRSCKWGIEWLRMYAKDEKLNSKQYADDIPAFAAIFVRVNESWLVTLYSIYMLHHWHQPEQAIHYIVLYCNS